LSWKYFFVVPVVLAGLTAICLAIALVLTARPQAAQLLSPQTGGVRQ
jgi:hypothetical protein